jgi:hypothetical protein
MVGPHPLRRPLRAECARWIGAGVRADRAEQQHAGCLGRAIFGLFGATFALARRLNFDVRWIIGLIVINLGITFVVPGISWQGHVGGLLTGAAVGAVYAYAPRTNRVLIQAAFSVAVLVLFVAVVWWRTAGLLAGVGGG